MNRRGGVWNVRSFRDVDSNRILIAALTCEKYSVTKFVLIDFILPIYPFIFDMLLTPYPAISHLLLFACR
jgi:hypothetical protein